MDYKSKMGYRKDSPYKNDLFIDIFSPEGLIDMSKTGKDLIGRDEFGNTMLMKAGRKEPYQFQGQVVREIPLEEFAKGGLTASKAKEMLRDGTANGKKLTKKQKGYFGWVAGGKKQDGGEIKGPVGFMKSYFNSDKFKERAKNKSHLQNPSQFAMNLDKVKAYTLPEGYSKNIGETLGSRMWNDDFTKSIHTVDPNLYIPPGTTMLLDTDQAKKDLNLPINDKVNYLWNDVFPHELGHASGRPFDNIDEMNFVLRNRLDKGKALKEFSSKEFQNYQSEKYKENLKLYEVLKDDKFLNIGMSFSEYIKKGRDGGHDLAPDENYSDLNTFRYLLFKEKINDPRIQDFNINDLKKAKDNPYIKKSFNFKRLQKTFSDEDLIWLMNNIATNQNNISNTAKFGGINKQLQMGGNPYTNTGNELFDFLFEEDAPVQAQQEVQSDLEEGEVDLTELREREQELNDREQYLMALQIAMDTGENPYQGIQGGPDMPIENVGNPASFSYNYLLQKGYKPEVAAGIVGNIQHESNFNPFAVGDRGRARGLAQWHPDRYRALSEKFNLNSIEGNLDAIDYELKTSENKALQKINTARTPEEAALLVDRHFERSAGLSTKQRMNTAKNVYNFFK